jgi:hypothetical protein
VDDSKAAIVLNSLCPRPLPQGTVLCGAYRSWTTAVGTQKYCKFANSSVGSAPGFALLRLHRSPACL